MPRTFRQAADILFDNEASDVAFHCVKQLHDSGHHAFVNEAAFVDAVRRISARDDAWLSPPVWSIDDYYAGLVGGHIQRWDPSSPSQAPALRGVRVAPGQIADFIRQNGVLDVEMDEIGAVVDGPIATTGLDPCIAVGLTATSAGRRCNALFHWSGTVDKAADVIDALGGEVQAELDVDAAGLGDVGYYVLGGQRSSLLNQLQLLEHLEAKRLPVRAINLFNDPGDVDSAKSVVIHGDGTVSYDVISSEA
jgi:hypothetical protein